MIDRTLLKSLILEQKKAISVAALGIEREKYPQVVEQLSLPHALIITGVRRAGKSTLLQQIIHDQFNDQVYYFNFEDERLIGFDVHDFNTLYEIMIELYGVQKIFCFDEIQNVSDWERFVRRLYNENFKFIITGSNASLLSKELGTKLTGRHIQIELLPYSFKEFLTYQKINYSADSFLITNDRGLLKKQFNEYLRIGGIPEYVQYRSPYILTTLYDNIIYKDIIVRYEIHSVRAFRELALYLISNIGSLISYSKLKNSLNLGSINTVKNYIHYLENSYLIFTIDSYAYSIMQQTVSQKKVYAIDLGLVEILGIQFSPNIGKYLENMVFLELRRRYKSIHYYKTNNQLEVDFVILEGRKIIALIQVCESLANKKTRERELTALKKAMAELKVSQAMILTLDETETIEFENYIITVLPIYQWLLESY